ncbi:prominin-like protein isoform X3 [Musca domestica]|uniref:Prominin-like protein isoform X3 n=1 Tax=Musca domestica TaxID=7370 RepID=A0ABM3UPP4_MUSDO|nr:prominin-like protein isoform X3 [Musca domestica]
MTGDNDRRSVIAGYNMLPLKMLLSLLVVCILFGSSTEAFENGLKFKQTKYTEWSKNVTYLSKTSYNARGMKPLYEISHKVMWFLIGGEDPIPDGYFELKDGQVLKGPKAERNEWGDLVLHYWPILLIVLLVAILVASMPIIGLCFCCCRCAGACGGRSEPFDKKHDTCRRVFLGFLLILLATGILFGVIVAFATNSYMQFGIDDGTDAVRAGSKDTQKFLATTSEQLEYVLVNNYKQLSDHLEDILRTTSDYIITNLEQQSKAISVSRLTEFLEKLPSLKNKLQQMKTITNDLRVYASQLSDGLRGVKRDLLVMLNKCSDQSCKDVLNRYEIGKLDANGIHYDQLPDVSIIIDNLDQLINDNIASAGEKGSNALKQMRSHLNNTIASYTPQIIESINKAGEGLQKVSNDIKTELDKVSKVIDTNTNKYTNIADNYLVEYGPYRFYVGIGVCSILLLVLVCLVAALLCGICGKRPDGYGDDCCNKGSGSRFLMFAVAIIFLTISGITIIALVHFLIGIVTYRGVCVPLRNPQDDAVFAEFDNLIDLNEVLYPSKIKGQAASGSLPPFHISHVIVACQKNQTIYEVLHINNMVDINAIKEYPADYKINKTLDDLVNGIDFNDSNVDILSPADKQRILELGQSALKDFDSDQFVHNLNDNITKHSLTDIAQQLRETAKKITSSDMKDVQISLRNQALHLETYEQNLVIPMKTQSAELIKLAKELDSTLTYKEQKFQQSIPLLVTEIEQAQTFIRKDGRNFVKSSAETFTNHFAGEIDRYLNMVVNAVENKIGICHPMANVYEAGIVAACNNIIDPLNGFWAGVFWCVILFLPTLIVAVKLSSLYQKSDPYPGPLVESEYLYDAYSERDHIPLSNGPKNKRRKNKDRRRRDYYEDPIVSTSHGIPPAGAGVRDTRYSDMAPKSMVGAIDTRPKALAADGFF